jgi:hypothetical protein
VNWDKETTEKMYMTPLPMTLRAYTRRNDTITIVALDNIAMAVTLHTNVSFDTTVVLILSLHRCR